MIWRRRARKAAGRHRRPVPERIAPTIFPQRGHRPSHRADVLPRGGDRRRPRRGDRPLLQEHRAEMLAEEAEQTTPPAGDRQRDRGRGRAAARRRRWSRLRLRDRLGHPGRVRPRLVRRRRAAAGVDGQVHTGTAVRPRGRDGSSGVVLPTAVELLPLSTRGASRCCCAAAPPGKRIAGLRIVTREGRTPASRAGYPVNAASAGRQLRRSSRAGRDAGDAPVRAHRRPLRPARCWSMSARCRGDRPAR